VIVECSEQIIGALRNAGYVITVFNNREQAKYLEAGKRSFAGESIMALMRNFA